jgi:hypothetical protein
MCSRGPESRDRAVYVIAANEYDTSFGEKVGGHIVVRQRKPIVAPPQDGAMAGLPIDEDDGHPIRSTRDDERVAHVDVFSLQPAACDIAETIVAKPTDVRDAPTEARQTHSSACRFAARQFAKVDQRQFGVRLRMAVHDCDEIDAVLTNGHNVKGARGS